jgi:hypothetical protein
LTVPIKSTVPGLLGVHFWFEITEPCELTYSFSKDGFDFYAAPRNLSKSYEGGLFLGINNIAQKDQVGIFTNSDFTAFGWYVDNSHFNGMPALWTRPFKNSELGLIEKETKTLYDTSGTVCLVKVNKINSDSIGFNVICLTDGRKNEDDGTVYVALEEIPGYFNMLGGTLDIDRVKDGMMFYSWDKQPQP